MASGDTLATLNPNASMPPASNPASISTTGADLLVLLYDDATTESRYWSFKMPGQYDGTSALTVELEWKFLTYVGSQTCDWEVSFYAVADDTNSIDSLTFATAQAVLATEAGTAGEVDYATIAFTNAQADGIQPNERCIVKIARDATGGTASPGDAELLGAEIRLS